MEESSTGWDLKLEHHPLCPAVGSWLFSEVGEAGLPMGHLTEVETRKEKGKEKGKAIATLSREY